MANHLIARAAAMLPVLSLPATADAQIELHGTENVPGRVFYQCRKHFGGETPAGGSLEATKDVAEDGTLLRMQVRWFSYISEDARFGGNHGITPLNGASTEGFVELGWPARYSTRETRLDWDNPEAQITLKGSYEAFDRERSRKEPWRQILVDRDNRLFVREFDEEEDVRYIYWSGEPVLASGFLSPSTSGFTVRLGDLAHWAKGVEAVTVYETRVRFQRVRRSVAPTPPGPHRIIVAYRFTPDPLTDTARKVREAIEEWEASISDFRSECERFDEVDESTIVVT